MTESPSTDITGTKKIVVLSFVGVVVVLSLMAAIVPEARTYCTEMVKTILGAIPTAVKM